MNINIASDIVERLEKAIATPGTALPDNPEILAARDYLVMTAQSLQMAVPDRLDCHTQTLVIGEETSSGMRLLLDQIQAAMAQDKVLRRKLTYLPNCIPAKRRWGAVLGALCLLGYGTWGLLHDSLYLVLIKRGGFKVHGPAAWLEAAAMACVALALISVIVDHYDRRDNEAVYRRVFDTACGLAILLYLAAALVGMVGGVLGF